MAKKKSKDKWTKKQLLFMQMLADPLFEVKEEDTATEQKGKEEYIAAKLKVKPETLTKWRRLPGFQRKVKKLAEVYLENGWPAVLKELSKKAKEGNMQAIKLFMDYTERHGKESQQEPSGKQGDSKNRKGSALKGKQFDIEALTKEERRELQRAIISRIKSIKGLTGKT